MQDQGRPDQRRRALEQLGHLAHGHRVLSSLKITVFPWRCKNIIPTLMIRNRSNTMWKVYSKAKTQSISRNCAHLCQAIRQHHNQSSIFPQPEASAPQCWNYYCNLHHKDLYRQSPVPFSCHNKGTKTSSCSPLTWAFIPDEETQIKSCKPHKTKDTRHYTHIILYKWQSCQIIILPSIVPVLH